MRQINFRHLNIFSVQKKKKAKTQQNKIKTNSTLGWWHHWIKPYLELRRQIVVESPRNSP